MRRCTPGDAGRRLCRFDMGKSGMEKGKSMMILGASALQVPAIKKAKELGYKIILVDYDENAAGFPLADVKLVVSTLDMEEVPGAYLPAGCGNYFHQRRPGENGCVCERKAWEKAGFIL